MAIFEAEDNKGNKYIALLTKALPGEQEQLIAFISPVKGVKPEMLVSKLTELGLNAEIRESKGDVVDFNLA